MNLISRTYKNDIMQILCRHYSLQKKTHYDTLKLPKNCSAKEIKDAFIKMSKEFHPDKNKGANAQENFVQIVEAYSVLSKPSSRATYDCVISVPQATTTTAHRAAAPSRQRHYYNFNENIHYDQYTTGYAYSGNGHRQYQEKRDTNYSSWNQQQQYQAYQQAASAARQYKMYNSYIIIACVTFAVVGFVIQAFIVRMSFLSNKRKAEQKSKLIAEEYKKVRLAALKNGNEVQTRLMLEKIAAGSNPSVATASLGHSLASEKKDVAASILAQIGILTPNFNEELSPIFCDDL